MITKNCPKYCSWLTILMAILSIGGLHVGSVSAQEPGEENKIQPATPDTPMLELTAAGWLEAGSLSPAANISAQALIPADCTVMSSPVAGYEISRGQDSNDITDFANDLIANGFSLDTVDINLPGFIPSCVDVLIVQGSTQNSNLSSPYTAADATALKT